MKKSNIKWCFGECGQLMPKDCIGDVCVFCDLAFKFYNSKAKDSVRGNNQYIDTLMGILVRQFWKELNKHLESEKVDIIIKNSRRGFAEAKKVVNDIAEEKRRSLISHASRILNENI